MGEQMADGSGPRVLKVGVHQAAGPAPAAFPRAPFSGQLSFTFSSVIWVQGWEVF